MGRLDAVLQSAEEMLASTKRDRQQIRWAVLTTLHSASVALAGSFDFAAMAIIGRAMAELAALQAEGERDAGGDAEEE